MCGLAGAVDLGGQRTCRPWALSTMRHRGPDGEGHFLDSGRGACLEHCRLAIIDPENKEANQPFSDALGRWTIVYNGELFNYRELRRELEGRGATFRTDSDTEVVLTALSLEGPAALSRFRGMFAFLLWDADSRSLLAARDQIGVKPLYYAMSRGTFVAASELRTVIAHPDVAPTLDPSSVVEYLAFGYVAGERTLVNEVKKLEPGHYLTVNDGVVRTVEYWDVFADSSPDSDDPTEEIIDALDHAVASSLVSDVPISLMLSGGLDSSAIAALASKYVEPDSLTAYSVAFGLPSDEARTAARLAQDLGIRHRGILLTRDSILKNFDDFLRDLDVPSANPTWVAVAAIASAVAEEGNKVLIGGDGADEIFGGYNRWMTYLRFHDRYWCRMTPKGRRLIGHVAKPFARGLAGDIARRAREGGQLFVGSRPFHDDDLRTCLGPTGRSAAMERAPESRVRELRRQFDARHPRADQLAWMSYVSLKTDLVEDYLVRLDTMGMRHSVEGRVPLLDVDLVTLAFSLSQRVKVGQRYEQKGLYRKAVSAFLPNYITSLPKQGFCPPVTDWALSALRESSVSPVLVESEIVRSDAMATLREQRSSGASFATWSLGVLGAWCDANLA